MPKVTLESCDPKSPPFVAWLNTHGIQQTDEGLGCNGFPMVKYTGNVENLTRMIEMFWGDANLINLIDNSATIEILVEDPEVGSIATVISVSSADPILQNATAGDNVTDVFRFDDGEIELVQLYFSSVSAYLQWMTDHFA